jgi:hypothetical protein
MRGLVEGRGELTAAAAERAIERMGGFSYEQRSRSRTRTPARLNAALGLAAP